jgi:glucokinase
LIDYLWERTDQPRGAEATHISVERVCSGIGLPNLYQYLRDTGQAEEPDWLASELASVSDPTPVIIGAALGPEPVPLCGAALELFVSILGAEAGNLALMVLATGGLYLAGGIPRRIVPALERDGFHTAFRSKGRMEDLLCNVPVHVISNPQVALLGAAALGLAQCQT